MKNLLLLLLALTTLPTVRAAESVTGLTAEIFSFPDALDDFPKIEADKKPILTRVDKSIDFEGTQEAWKGTELVDHFFIRWTGSLVVAKDGKYTFFLESDDGSRLFINGKPVIDHGGLHAFEEKSGDIELKAGTHEIKVEYFENEVDAGCRLSWEGAGKAREVVPTTVLKPKAIASGAAKETKAEPKKSALPASKE